MQKIDIINNSFKFFYINVFILYIFIKIVNYKEIKKHKVLIIIIFFIFSSILYSILIKFMGKALFLLIYFPIYAFIMKYFTDGQIHNTLIVTITSIIITYLIYIFSIIIDGIIIYNIKLEHNNIINYLLIPIIEIILIKIIFRIKRIKNGFTFIKRIHNIKNISNFAFLFYNIVILMLEIFQVYSNDRTTTISFIISIIITIFFIIWIQDEITEQYRHNMRNHTIELQKIEIDEKVEEINELKDDNLKLSTVIHKYNNRLSALEKAVIKTLNNNLNTEFASELTKSLENIKTMSKEFSKEILGATNEKKKLPKTSVQSIDNIFEYMAEEAANSKINFNLKINNSINYLIENIVDVKEFETLIGDHIRDAIIAINSEETEYKSIMCILGIIDNCYEFSIYDTGIEFEINTLLNLGLKHITTHSETGGTGIGFMTSFETLNKYKGSLIIEEYSKETNIYTKSVTFRFDKKGEYRIYSYRSDQIKSKMNDKNRIKVKQI